MMTCQPLGLRPETSTGLFHSILLVNTVTESMWIKGRGHDFIFQQRSVKEFAAFLICCIYMYVYVFSFHFRPVRKMEIIDQKVMGH